MGSIAVLAHRGSPDPDGGVRENTLDAFVRARQMGADGVELDVRMTSDGALVVHHDAVVEGVGAIAELAASELPDYVPLLGAALDVCQGLIVNVEIKNLPGEPGFDPSDRVATEAAGLVMAAGRTLDVVISSFWPDTLAAVRHAGPDLATGLLVGSWADPGGAIATALSRGCTALHPHVDLVGADLVHGAHDAGLTVATWTVNRRSLLVTVQDAGVNAVITDDVALARAVVGPG
jgi:glycerophosphoryl diester phosphodiesterase